METGHSCGKTRREGAASLPKQVKTTIDEVVVVAVASRQSQVPETRRRDVGNINGAEQMAYSSTICTSGLVMQPGLTYGWGS